LPVSTIDGNSQVANRQETFVGDPITREIIVEAPPDVVWDALTDPRELAAWFGAEAEVELRVGGSIRFRWADGTERRGLVVDLDPPSQLTFRWRELRTSASGLAAAGATVVTFRLKAVGQRTRVTVTESPGVLADDPPLAMAEHG
jgi:uncharacterized protein YndB with AHSA1/START domain